jgi:putative SOS response-associated peptidase YedK
VCRGAGLFLRNRRGKNRKKEEKKKKKIEKTRHTVIPANFGKFQHQVPMCGRSRCTLTRSRLEAASGVNSSQWRDMSKFVPKNNMAPGNVFPVMQVAADGSFFIQAMAWGLIPGFTHHSAKPDHFKMFNARCETIFDKPSFKSLISRRRGIVFVDGYYEWKLEGGVKQPYYVCADDCAMRLACVFDFWRHDGSDEPLLTFSIVTCDADESISWLHDRQPFFLKDDDIVRKW